MYLDPDMIWEGDFPYNKLAFVGVTPETPIPLVQKAMGPILRERKMNGEVHQAWSQLSTVRDRLYIDFFLYRTLPEEESSS